MKQLMIFLLSGLLAFSGGREALSSWQANAAPQTAQARYQVVVTDAQGQPLAGAMVQLCTDTLCQVLQTNEQGQVDYSGAPYAYQVHLLRAPQGFLVPAETFTLPAQGGSLTIALARE